MIKAFKLFPFGRQVVDLRKTRSDPDNPDEFFQYAFVPLCLDSDVSGRQIFNIPVQIQLLGFPQNKITKSDTLDHAMNGYIYMRIHTMSQNTMNGFEMQWKRNRKGRFVTVLLCPKRDLNSHALSGATPSRWCVCQFHHSGNCEN